MSSTGTDTDPPEEILFYPFNYVPSFAAGVTFVVLFSLVTVLHLTEALRKRTWWLIPTVVTGGLSEIIGWCGRLWGSKNPTSMKPYLMQITTTIIAPTFILAANFLIVGRIIHNLGPQYSRLKPLTYTIVFCCCDVIALIVQSVGGAQASVASTRAAAVPGGHIALGGIAFQFCGIVIYMALTSEFLVRYYLDKPFPNRKDTYVRKSFGLDWKTKQMIIGVWAATFCMFIRGIYRTVELTGGWSGAIISNERLFIGLDASMIFLAMVVLLIFHPGRLIPRETSLMALTSQSVIEMVPKYV